MRTRGAKLCARPWCVASLGGVLALLVHGCTDELVRSTVPGGALTTSTGGSLTAVSGVGGSSGAAGAADGGTASEATAGVGGASGAAGSTGTAGSAAGGGTGGTTTTGGTGGTGIGGAGATGEIVGAGGSAGGAGAPAVVPLEGEPCAGYTLIGSPENDAGADHTASLVDMEGNEVHRWSITGFPPKMLPGGSLIGCQGVFPTSYDCIEMVQVSWEGDAEWSFDDWAALVDGQTASRHHHDFQREGNPVGYYAPGRVFVDEGKTLVLAHNRVTVPEIREGELDDDVIYEVDWAGVPTGFEWHGVDHVAEFGFDEAALEDIRTRSATRLEWLHGNAIARLGPNRWYDAGREEFHPDNIIYSSRRANLIAIISHATGEVVWRVGPDFEGRPEAILGQFMGQHMPHMIPEGLPGAGNILVFDNGTNLGYGNSGGNRGWSRVVEFDPTTFEVVWQYGSAAGPADLNSPILSGAQRLPNGNTLITVGVKGRVIEVTPDAEIVWEYQYAANSSGPNPAWVYRAYRIPPEWLPLGENEAHGNYASWESLFER